MNFGTMTALMSIIVIIGLIVVASLIIAVKTKDGKQKNTAWLISLGFTALLLIISFTGHVVNEGSGVRVNEKDKELTVFYQLKDDVGTQKLRINGDVKIKKVAGKKNINQQVKVKRSFLGGTEITKYIDSKAKDLPDESLQ